MYVFHPRDMLYCFILTTIWNIIMDCIHICDLICTIMLVGQRKYFWWVVLKVRNSISFQQGYYLNVGDNKCFNYWNIYIYANNKPQIYPKPVYFIMLIFYTTHLVQWINQLTKKIAVSLPPYQWVFIYFVIIEVVLFLDFLF